MAVSHLECKECGAEYGPEARYVCERCFGPLEVAYDERRGSAGDVGELRRRIQGGPQNIWRYADFLPLAGGPPGPSGRLASRVGLPAGCTPLVRADRLAERLGLGEVWVKNDAANPTHSFKDRVVSVAATRARELGYEVLACASTGNLANSVAAHGAALGLETYVFIPADLEEQKILATGVYGTNLVKVRGSYDDVNRLCTRRDGLRGRARRLPPSEAGHDREVAGHRQSGRRPLRARPGPAHRRGGGRGDRRRDPHWHPPAGRDDGDLHRDGRGRHDRR